MEETEPASEVSLSVTSEEKPWESGGREREEGGGEV